MFLKGRKKSTSKLSFDTDNELEKSFRNKIINMSKSHKDITI